LKLILEQDSLNEKGEKIIIKVKDVSSKSQAIQSKSQSKSIKSYLHTCRHEEGLPCRREEI